MKTLIDDLNLSHLWIVYPGTESYSLAENSSALAISDIRDAWHYPNVTGG